jgi:hypothetical protein
MATTLPVLASTLQPDRIPSFGAYLRTPRVLSMPTGRPRTREPTAEQILGIITPAKIEVNGLADHWVPPAIR